MYKEKKWVSNVKLMLTWDNLNNDYQYCTTQYIHNQYIPVAQVVLGHQVAPLEVGVGDGADGAARAQPQLCSYK